MIGLVRGILCGCIVLAFLFAAVLLEIAATAHIASQFTEQNKW